MNNRSTKPQRKGEIKDLGMSEVVKMEEESYKVVVWGLMDGWVDR